MGKLLEKNSLQSFSRIFKKAKLDEYCIDGCRIEDKSMHRFIPAMAEELQRVKEKENKAAKAAKAARAQTAGEKG
tara:strand:+ start:205 stop:429 length:225 start_codon:yes stop_codon:yes gene_type:complete